MDDLTKHTDRPMRPAYRSPPPAQGWTGEMHVDYEVLDGLMEEEEKDHAAPARTDRIARENAAEQRIGEGHHFDQGRRIGRLEGFLVGVLVAVALDLLWVGWGWL